MWVDVKYLYTLYVESYFAINYEHLVKDLI